jgi:hypothetical protein
MYLILKNIRQEVGRLPTKKLTLINRIGYSKQVLSHSNTFAGSEVFWKFCSQV